jgi:UDP-glucose 4-epimerase
MKKILITGGAGFIGYHLANHLLRTCGTECRLVLADNLSRGRMDTDFSELLKDPRVSFMQCNLTDPASCDKLGGGYDHVYHLAAVNGTRYFYEKPHEVLRINTLSLFNMLHWFKDHNKDGKFCFPSSNEAYAGGLNAFGKLPIPTPEDVPLVIESTHNPRWTYSATKLIGELAVINYAKTYNLRALVVRPHNFYGPRAGYEHVIPEFSQRITSKTDPFLIHNPDHTRTFCYIGDAVRAMQMLMDSPKTDGQPETVHIGSSDEIAINDLAEKMFCAAGWRPTSLEAKSSHEGSVKRRLADITKLQNLVGWAPEVSLDQGLKMTFDWYSKHPCRTPSRSGAPGRLA